MQTLVGWQCLDGGRWFTELRCRQKHGDWPKKTGMQCGKRNGKEEDLDNTIMMDRDNVLGVQTEVCSVLFVPRVLLFHVSN